MQLGTSGKIEVRESLAIKIGTLAQHGAVRFLSGTEAPQHSKIERVVTGTHGDGVSHTSLELCASNVVQVVEDGQRRFHRQRRQRHTGVHLGRVVVADVGKSKERVIHGANAQICFSNEKPYSSQ